MICSKCKRELSEDGKCVGCGLPQEECTCSVAEETPEAGTSEESQPSEEPTDKPAEEKTV